MRALQKFAILRPIATAMFYGAVVLMGIIAFGELEVNLLPDLEFPRLTVITAFPDASPEEVENLITRPLAESVRTVGGVRQVLSESVEGVSFISLQFDWDISVDFAAMEVREKVDIVRGVMPENAGRSIISRFDPGEEPFLEVAIFSRGLDQPKHLRDFVRRNVKGYLDRVDGVALVNIQGGYRKEVQVNVDQGLMLAHGLSLIDLEGKIATTNLNSPAGSITAGDKDILIRTVGEYTSLEDVGRTVVASNERGAPVRLQALADIQQGFQERTGLARYNGRECVLVGLKRESGKNIVNSARLARLEIERLKKRFERELDIRIIYDQSTFINRSINNLITALVVGGMLAFVALILILRNLRSPLILLSVIPVSLLATFILLYIRDISLNMMSLGGLALGIGMLFDSGNVVLSAIERHNLAGLSPREAALRGAGEVAGSVSAAVLTTVIVFLPVVFLKSVIGVVFEEMALTITFSLLVSMFTALTLIPMLASLNFLRGEKYDLMRFRPVRLAAGLERDLELIYGRRLAKTLDNPRKLLFVVFLLFSLALISYHFVSREFVPRVDTGEIQIELEARRGSSLETTTELLQYLDKSIKTEVGPEHIIARAGYDSEELLGRQGGDAGKHRASLRILLGDDRSRTSREAIEELRDSLAAGEGTSLRFFPGGDVLGSLLSSEARGVALDLSGDDLEVLRDLGVDISERLTDIPGLSGVTSSLNERGRELHFLPDPDRMSAYNLSNQYVARYLNTAIGGSVVSQLRIGDEEIDVRIRARNPERVDRENIERMRMAGEDGRILHVTQAGRMAESSGFTSILRQGPVRVNRVSADLVTGDLDRVARKMEEIIKGLTLPEGYSIRFAGERENIERSFRELLFAFLLAALLIYMLLSAQFESFRYSFAMMGAIPLIVIGIFPALAVTGKSLNVSSFTGMILLIGIVVDNGALFYEYIHILRAEGLSLKAAIQDAGPIVLRPVLMNNMTTVLAMLPVALEIGEGSEFQSPMAITVISGLLTAVFLSLFVVPVLFYKLMSREEGRAAGEDE